MQMRVMSGIEESTGVLWIGVHIGQVRGVEGNVRLCTPVSIREALVLFWRKASLIPGCGTRTPEYGAARRLRKSTYTAWSVLNDMGFASPDTGQGSTARGAVEQHRRLCRARTHMGAALRTAAIHR